MANFPDVILTPKVYRDKGAQITGESHTVTTNYTFSLATYAKRRETTTDGRILSSSIFVSNGSENYTEVYSTPVPSGSYFYSYDDPAAGTTKLLFNSTHSQVIPLLVNYTTRGDIITAARATQVETDIAAIENALGSKTVVLQVGTVTDEGTVSVPIDTTRVPILEISAITVLVSDVDGGVGPAFQVADDSSAVTIVCNGRTINYLFVVHKS